MFRSFFLFLIISLTVRAQDPDTLLSHILNLENDTQKVNQLYTIGFSLIDKDPVLSFSYAQYCEKIAQKSKSPRHVAKSYNLKGILLFKHGLNKKALNYFEKYLQCSKELKNKIGEAFAFTNLGNIYLQLQQYEKAESYFLQALNMYNFLNNRVEVANGLINLGVVKHEQMQLEAASENYLQALKISDELNNYEIRAMCLNNIAQVFSDKGDLEKALAYNYDALELREMMGLEVDMADSYLSIAEIALRQKNIVLADEILNEAKNLCYKLHYLEAEITYHKLCSELNAQKNNFELALFHLKFNNHLHDSLLLLQKEELVYDFETINSDINEKIIQKNYEHISNKPMIALLLTIIIFISYIIFKHKR